MKNGISKRKMPFFCNLKGLSNKQKIFSCQMHFNFSHAMIAYHWVRIHAFIARFYFT